MKRENLRIPEEVPSGAAVGNSASEGRLHGSCPEALLKKKKRRSDERQAELPRSHTTARACVHMLKDYHACPFAVSSNTGLLVP